MCAMFTWQARLSVLARSATQAAAVGLNGQAPALSMAQHGVGEVIHRIQENVLMWLCSGRESGA